MKYFNSSEKIYIFRRLNLFIYDIRIKSLFGIKLLFLKVKILKYKKIKFKSYFYRKINKQG